MYDGVKPVLGQFGVPLENCVAVAVDNTNAHMGAHHSLKTLMTKDKVTFSTTLPGRVVENCR